MLAGLASMILLIPINGLIASKMKTLQLTQMKNKDQRAKLMNEVNSWRKWPLSFGATLRAYSLRDSTSLTGH